MVLAGNPPEDHSARRGQSRPKVGGAFDIPLIHLQRGSLDPLQVGGLGLDEQFVHRLDLDVVDQAQIDPQANIGEQEHGLFTRDVMSGAEHTVGPAHLVVEDLALFRHQGLPRGSFVLNDLGDDIVEALDEGLLALAESLLIGNLVKVPKGRRPLARRS